MWYGETRRLGRESLVGFQHLEPRVVLTTIDLAALIAGQGATVYGADAGDRSGISVSGAGDVNGDGFDDLIIGARYGDAAGNAKTYAGDSYILFGGDLLGGVVTHQGTAAAETLTGDASANVIIGGQDDDVLIGGGGADSLRGGEGDDTLAISDLGFTRAVGGTGTDTLRLDTAAATLDLTTLADNRLLGIGQIDIGGSGANTLVLDVQEVLAAVSREPTHGVGTTRATRHGGFADLMASVEISC